MPSHAFPPSNSALFQIVMVLPLRIKMSLGKDYCPMEYAVF